MLSRRSVRILSVAAITAVSFSVAPAEAKNKAVEFLKYFNPVPEESYTNSSQDREIKKKKFKAVEVPGAKPITNNELGYFAQVPFEKVGDAGYLTGLLSRPEINGLSVILPWALLNPTEDEFNWQPVDRILALAKESKKTVILRISTCGLDNSRKSDTPDWVLTSEVKSLAYTGPDGKEHKMPIFWDSTYLAKWSNFVAEMGEHLDKNPAIHSIGITGGGVLGSTGVIPDFAKKDKTGDKAVTEKTVAEKPADAKTGEKPKTVAAEPDAPVTSGAYKQLEKTLRTEFGMSERQLIEHWKYVSDMFPKYFETARLNFDINPPLNNKKGQSALDEISDYLVYRYGQRVYLTRQDVEDGKHGFNEYRVLLKFHPDTLTGYALSNDFDMKDLTKLVNNAKTDGISFCELPPSFVGNKDQTIETALADIRKHMGYQLVSQQVQLPKNIKVGEPIKASFTFVNLGTASAMKPSRQLDKDIASSYKVQLELRNPSGKPVLRSQHTPEIGTNEWAAGQPIVWNEDLKTAKIQPGKYDVYLSLIDVDTKRKLNFLNAIETGKDPKPALEAAVGSIEIIQ
ncbi:MAG: DUF4832 domain-containing protein [Cyanobacteria bacterium]|nr:DUF4832 domain-containing protein [Cyanobacteriota bacterium]